MNGERPDGLTGNDCVALAEVLDALDGLLVTYGIEVEAAEVLLPSSALRIRVESRPDIRRHVAFVVYGEHATPSPGGRPAAGD